MKTTMMMANVGGGSTVAANAGQRPRCANCGKPKLPTASISAETAAHVRAAVEHTVRSTLRSILRPSLTQQVEAEVKKHPSVIASVDEANGVVNTYLPPQPYYLATDADGVVTTEVQALRARVSELEAEVAAREANGASAAELMRLKAELDEARLQLELAEDPRRQERRRQGVGNGKVPRVVIDHNGAIKQ
jgi:hypothetical protein